jgi:hypothetical protein
MVDVHQELADALGVSRERAKELNFAANYSTGGKLMDVNVAFYHGITHQIRRVLGAMTEEEIDKGIDAFETGSSDWSNCFFARALEGRKEFTEHRGELGVAMALGLSNNSRLGYNLVHIRLIYHTFDSCSTFLTRDELKRLITDIRDESRPSEVMNLLKQIDYTGVEEKVIPDEQFTCVI